MPPSLRNLSLATHPPFAFLRMPPSVRNLSLLGAAACACGWAWLELRRRRQRLSLCAKYCLDPRRGFMLPVATALPEAFDVWERIALDLPALNRSAGLRTAVDRALPVDPLAVAALSPAEQRRAYVLFASVAHSYVNGGSVPWAKLDSTSATASAAVAPSAAMPELPAQLAAPWRAVCAELGVPCVFIATGMDLWNAMPLRWWQQPAVRNYRQSISMSGCRSECGFHAVRATLTMAMLTVAVLTMAMLTMVMLTMALTWVLCTRQVPHAIQHTLTPLLPSLLLAPEMVAGRRWRQLTRLLRGIGAALRRVRLLLGEIPEVVDVDEFYDVYRPLLGGWAEGGLKLRGATTASDCVVHWKGPSAGQTALLLLLDMVLGVEHRTQVSSFQREMREHYLPAPHAQLLQDIEARLAQSGSARHAAALPGAPLRVGQAHSEALDALAAMRAYHLGIASRYLRRTGTGTGGSDFRPMLGEAVQSTREASTACGA